MIDSWSFWSISSSIIDISICNRPYSSMTQDKVIPTEQGLAGLDLNDPQIHELIQRAQDADAADKKLTVKEALKKYKKAVFWACLLSVSLIMEGYDLVMVRLPYLSLDWAY